MPRYKPYVNWWFNSLLESTNWKGKTLAHASTRSTNVEVANPQPEQSKGITVERITPPMRRLGQHAYYLESVQIEDKAIGLQKQEVIVNYKVQNYGNERWSGRAHPIISFGNEKYTTPTTSTKLYLSLDKGKSERITAKYKLNKAIAGDFTISFQETNQRGLVVFIIKTNNNGATK